MDTSNATTTPTNIAVIRGTVQREPSLRTLPTGTVVAQFDLAAEFDAGDRVATVAVPVAWHDPTTAQLDLLTAASDVVVVGTVRRRFFRAGGATQSRTEVVADVVIPVRRRKQAARALAAAADRVLAMASSDTRR